MSALLKNKLKATRQKLSLTQKELAALLTIPLPTLIRWENDQNTPYPFTQREIIKHLDSLTKES